jgi:hypothetical protein
MADEVKQRKDDKGRVMRRCGTMEKHFLQVAADPEYVRRRLDAERRAEDYRIAAGRGNGGRGAVLRIPVVVHVVYNTTAENISNAQINSQINVLNTDFRLLNSIADVPAVFSPLAADSRLEFALAVRDPNCQPTTGITRTNTSVTSWPDFSDAMKATATDGIDPWPTDRYLNIWVIADGGSFLGWAQFPGSAAAIDGVVIRHPYFGTSGTVTSSMFGGGRTATHEIGHWLNLLHIWGDSGCGIDDVVTDTPKQDSSNFGCPTHPSASCSNGGDMFMNYMDYVDDGCMRLFSLGQVDRMHAALATSRPGVLGANGLTPPPGGTSVADLWIADTADDTGAEPNPTSDVMWISPDIWVRNQNDGIANQAHQNPEYRPAGSPTSHVYVRVRNTACTASGSATLRLYWAKASSGLSWPTPWDGSVTTPALMGGAIGSQPVTVAGGATVTVSMPWSPPNPADYASFGADRGHFCLLARLETSSTAPFGMTTAETTNLNTNVRNNNNIAWKNITVVDEEPGSGRFGSMLVQAPAEDPGEFRLEFDSSDPRERTLFDWGYVIARLDERLYEIWKEGGEAGEGLENCFDGGIVIGKPSATIDGLRIEAKQLHNLDLQFVPKLPRPPMSALFTLNVSQWMGDELIGGVTFDVPVAAKDSFADVGCALTHRWDGVNWMRIAG